MKKEEKVARSVMTGEEGNRPCEERRKVARSVPTGQEAYSTGED